MSQMKENTSSVRVRFAPSPTGYLHVGGLRTALYNYLFAKRNNGTFILRIEDTDQSRLVPDALQKLTNTLGIFFQWDDGPYVQSDRLNMYRQYAEELLEKGKAYCCFCSPERLQSVRKQQSEKKEPTRYDGHCSSMPAEWTQHMKENNAPYVVRLRIDGDGDVSFVDAVRGRVSFDKKSIDDQVLLKSDGFPTYHLANVVDDHLMNISHVIRGEEWISSTPKHILLYEAFGWRAPVFAHIPLLLNPDKSKLSKRQGDVSVEEYLAKGYMPGALINFVAFLGWNPGEGETRELFSIDELAEIFDLDHIHKGGAVFDTKKLEWMNAEYIKKLSPEVFFSVAEEYLRQKPWYAILSNRVKSREFLERVFALEKERIKKFSDIADAVQFLFVEPVLDASILPWKGNAPEDARKHLDTARMVLERVDQKNWSKDYLAEILFEMAGNKRGDFLWPLRVALSGERKSPPPHEIAWVLGKEETILRIEKALLVLPDSE